MSDASAVVNINFFTLIHPWKLTEMDPFPEQRLRFALKFVDGREPTLVR